MHEISLCGGHWLHWNGTKTQIKTETNICSGTLVKETWVITAGSCIHKYSNREHFVVFDEYNKGDVIVRKVKVLNRQLFTYAESNEDPYSTIVEPTLLGMLEIETLNIKTLAKLSSYNYRQCLGVTVVYVEYFAVYPKELKTNRLQITKFVISRCPTSFKAFICVQDRDNALSTYVLWSTAYIQRHSHVSLCWFFRKS